MVSSNVERSRGVDPAPITRVRGVFEIAKRAMRRFALRSRNSVHEPTSGPWMVRTGGGVRPRLEAARHRGGCGHRRRCDPARRVEPRPDVAGGLRRSERGHARFREQGDRLGRSHGATRGPDPRGNDLDDHERERGIRRRNALRAPLRRQQLPRGGAHGTHRRHRVRPVLARGHGWGDAGDRMGGRVLRRARPRPRYRWRYRADRADRTRRDGLRRCASRFAGRRGSSSRWARGDRRVSRSIVTDPAWPSRASPIRGS